MEVKTYFFIILRRELINTGSLFVIFDNRIMSQGCLEI